MAPKPEHQWETRRRVAVRDAEHPGGAWTEDSRAEAFDLGGARVVFGLHRQELDDEAAGDPDVVFAAKAWLLARGQRELALFGPEGPLARGPIAPADLNDHVDAPSTLVSLAPSIAEMADALGVFDRVLACEDSSDHPPEVNERERLGPDLGPNLDRVAELRPDLVLASLSVPGMERVVTGLRARGVPQFVCAARSIDEVLGELRRLGDVLGVPERAREVVARMEAERAELAGAAAKHEPLRVYLEWWPRPMFTPGADCYSNELIALAGGHNVFEARAGSSLQVEPAELVSADPEVCFVSWCGVPAEKLDPDNLRQREGLERLPAAERGHVFAVDEAFTGRPGPRMLEAARRMARHVARVRAAR